MLALTLGCIMNKVFGIQNYNNLVIFNRNSNSKNIPKSKTEISFRNQYITSETSSVAMAYGSVSINNKILPQMPLQKFLKWLEVQHKIDGKDFKVDLETSNVTIMNKLGQEEFRVHYNNGNHDFWDSYETNEYKNNKLYKSVLRDRNNNISLITQIYNNNDPTIEHLLEFKYGTSPKDFYKTLKDRYINCEIEYSNPENGFNTVSINVYDENKKITDVYSFYYGKKQFDEQYLFASKSKYNKEGQEYKTLIFNKDTTNVTLII